MFRLFKWLELSIKNITFEATSDVLSKVFPVASSCMISRILGSVSLVIFVSINEGLIQLEVMLNLLFSLAHELLIERRYCLFAVYSENPIGGFSI